MALRSLAIAASRCSNAACELTHVRCFSASTARFSRGDWKQQFGYEEMFKWRMIVKLHRQRAKWPAAPKTNPTGFYVRGKFYEVPEMIPEFIVPDLTDFALKPYVDWKCEPAKEAELTARDLFEATYGKAIREKLKPGLVKKEDLDSLRAVYERSWQEADRKRAGLELGTVASPATSDSKQP